MIHSPCISRRMLQGPNIFLIYNMFRSPAAVTKPRGGEGGQSHPKIWIPPPSAPQNLFLQHQFFVFFTFSYSFYYLFAPVAMKHGKNERFEGFKSVIFQKIWSCAPKPLTNKTGLAHQPPQYFPSGFGVARGSPLFHPRRKWKVEMDDNMCLWCRWQPLHRLLECCAWWL